MFGISDLNMHLSMLIVSQTLEHFALQRWDKVACLICLVGRDCARLRLAEVWNADTDLQVHRDCAGVVNSE